MNHRAGLPPRTSFRFGTTPPPSQSSQPSQPQQSPAESPTKPAPWSDLKAPLTAAPCTNTIDNGVPHTSKDSTGGVSHPAAPPPPPLSEAASAAGSPTSEAEATQPSTTQHRHSYTLPPHLQDSVELGTVLTALDPSQRAAACFPPDAPLLVQAGAGSGKTQTMASRIAFLLLCGVPARNVLGICFTRQAAETLRQRVRAVLPPSLQPSVQLLTLKTLHSFGLQCLRRFGVIGPETEVFDAAQQRKLARRVVEQYAVHTKGSEAVDALIDYVNTAKTKKDLPAPQMSPNVQDGYLFRFYETALHDEEKAVDFGDLQRMFFTLIRPTRGDATDGGGDPPKVEPEPSSQLAAPSSPPPAPQTTRPRSRAPLQTSPACEMLRSVYTHIIVDEFQDLNEIQFEILAHLAGDACRVTCVGDPNQCIYEWRGALSNVFQMWMGRFPGTELRILEINYRSDGEIVSALNGLVNSAQQAHYHRQDRKITILRCNTEDDVTDAVPFVIEKIFKALGDGVGFSDMAVLCRTRRRVQHFCEVLRARNIPVKELKGVAPDGISIVRALLAYLKLAIRPDLDSEVRMALCGGPRYLPVKQAKNLFFGLGAMAAERRERQFTARHDSSNVYDAHTLPHSGYSCGGGGGGGDDGYFSQSPSSSLLGSPSGVPIAPDSFYALLSEAAFHDFSLEQFPKLKGPSKAQWKMLKHFVAVVREAHDRLYRAQHCDVADLIRYVAAEGGFESADAVTVDGGAASVAAATGRKRRRTGGGTTTTTRASRSLAEDVAAELTTAAPTAEAQLQARQDALASQLAKMPRNVDGDDGAVAAYTADEEAAMLATSRVSVTELLLCAYEDVMEEVQEEAAEAASGGGAAARSPAMVLSRVLDQFVTLLPSDDFGSLRSLADRHKAEGAAPDATATQTATSQYPSGHRQSTAVNRVTVATVHRAKGMEWPCVIVPDCWVGEFPLRVGDREERRVFYVAISRAMMHLYLVTAGASNNPRYTSRRNDTSTAVTAAPVNDNGEVQRSAPLQQTPYLTAMKEKEAEEKDFACLRLAVMKASGTW